jgi:UDP-N-acetylmuramyl pentapeptide synthase
MVAAILEEARLDGQPLRGRVLKTEGNFNNLVGLPLTLLRLRRGDKVAVVELGTNHPGESSVPEITIGHQRDHLWLRPIWKV